ncbi:MAG: class I SAM-dependent methyltransferase [Candidatus Micrarchaeota archaeon]|nr:class I SAM-dependent methyltransferase [Candidatus Micrarchaeota archaeon]
MQHSKMITSHFESLADYGAVEDKVVPQNAELHERVFNELKTRARGSFKFLDLGIGTGATDEKILAQFPTSKAVGIALSKKMLSKAMERLKKFGNRVTLINGNFESVELGDGYDFVISEVAIHNSIDEEKIRLFKRVYDSLKTGGIFINGDFIAGEDLAKDQRNKQNYLDFLKTILKGEELEAWVLHAFYEDKPAALSDQFRWLEEAGFKNIERIWAKANVAVYTAQK